MKNDDFVPGRFDELEDYDKLEKLIKRYVPKISRVIGRGSYGVAALLEDSLVFRVASLPPKANNEKSLATLIVMKKLLCKDSASAMLKHVLPPYYGFYNLKREVSAEIMPFMNEGTLRNFCCESKFDANKKRALWYQLIYDGYEALDFLFERFHVAHCDVSETNLYIQTDASGNPRLVIGDFDCVRKPRSVSLNPIGGDRTSTVPILAFMSEAHNDGHCLLLSRSSDYYLLLCSVSSTLWKCNFLRQLIPPLYVESLAVHHVEGLSCNERTRTHTFPCNYSANLLTAWLEDYDSVEAVVVKLLQYYGGEEVIHNEHPIFRRTVQALVEGRAIPVPLQEQRKYPGSVHYYVYLQVDSTSSSFQKHLVYLTSENRWRLVKKRKEALKSFY